MTTDVTKYDYLTVPDMLVRYRGHKWTWAYMGVFRGNREWHVAIDGIVDRRFFVYERR